MARFDVYRSAGGYLLDCQNDLLSHLNTRVVVPLVSADDAIPVEARLNPVVEVLGSEMVMLTHFAAAVPVKELGRPVASVAYAETKVAGALDLLLSGY